VLLAGLGWLHRSRTVRQLGDGSAPARHGAVPAFVALASVELLAMTIAVALAVGLSRTPPP